MSAIHRLLPSLDGRVGTRALCLNVLTVRYKSPLALVICVAMSHMISGCADQPASSSPVAIAKQAETSPAERRQAAEIAYSAGQFESAIELFTQLIQESPHDANNYFWRAQAYQRLRRYSEADADLATVIRMSPLDAEPLLRRSELNYARGRLPEAMFDCTKAIELGGALQPGARTLRAGLYLIENEYQKALDDCNEALRLDQDFVRAYINRGLARQGQGDLKGAVEDFSAAIERHKQVGDAYNNRGVVRMQLGQAELALADLSEAIRLAPLDPRGYDNRSRLLLEQLHQPEQAARDCTRLIQVVEREAKQQQGSVAGRKTAAIYARRALAEWKLNKSEAALADCQAALTIDANCLPAQKLLQEVVRKQQHQ